MAGVDLALRASVQGIEKLGMLRAQLEKINRETTKGNVVKRIAQTQADLSIKNTKAENSLLKEQGKLGANRRISMAKEKITNRELLEQRKLDMEIAERAVPLVKKGITTKTQALKLAEQQIMTERALAEEEQRRTRILEEQTRAEAIRRQELMQASIGMFVMGITMTQTLATMEQMAGKGTELGNVFKEMALGARFMLGPIQVITAAMQFLNMANKKMLVTMTGTMFLMAGMFLLWKAIGAQGKKMRFVFGALGTAMLSLGAIAAWNTRKQYAEAIARMTNWVMASGPGAPGMLALLLGIFAASIGVGAALAATAPKGQTSDGFVRPIRRTGLFYGHAGEGVGRIGAMSPGGGTGPRVEINNYINTDMDDGTLSRLADETEMAAVRGMETAFKTAQWSG